MTTSDFTDEIRTIPDTALALWDALNDQDKEQAEVTPLYIFDLDGTLALNGHRQGLIDPNREGGPDWDAFFMASRDDFPNWPVVSTLCALLDKGCDVWIWSGRGAIAMQVTIDWLNKVLSSDRREEIELCMRRKGDFTPDDDLKQSWLDAMSLYDRRRLVAVFDDRDKVVAMWRRNGVPCFQVAPGAF